MWIIYCKEMRQEWGLSLFKRNVRNEIKFALLAFRQPKQRAILWIRNKYKYYATTQQCAMCSTIRQATYERELETKWQNMHENWKLCIKCTQRATNNGSQQQKTTVWVCMCVRAAYAICLCATLGLSQCNEVRQFCSCECVCVDKIYMCMCACVYVRHLWQQLKHFIL